MITEDTRSDLLQHLAETKRPKDDYGWIVTETKFGRLRVDSTRRIICHVLDRSEPRLLLNRVIFPAEVEDCDGVKGMLRVGWSFVLFPVLEPESWRDMLVYGNETATVFRADTGERIG